MHISPVSTINNNKTVFQSKYKPLKMASFINDLGHQINTVSANKGALTLLTSLSFLAGSVFTAAIMLALGKNTKKKTQDNVKTENLEEKQQPININFEILFKEKPERNKYLGITSYFPNLNKKYQDMLTKTLAEPENNKNKSTVESIEKIFDTLSKDGGLKYRKSYFEALDKNSDCLDCVAKNLESSLANGDSAMHYLVLLKNEKITKENIKEWAECDKLSCDEFMLLKNYDENILKSINKLKETNNNFKITDFKELLSSIYNKNYAYKLSFNEGLSLEEKLKIVRDVHKAIYGNLYIKGEKQTDMYYVENDIKTELLDSIVKDNQLDSIFNFVKYIKPEAVENINLKSDQVKFLDRSTDLFKQIQNICMNEIVNLDFNSPKIVELTSIMSNDNLWGESISTRHARMRFITRFVLKDNPNADLTKDCQEKLSILYQELEKELDKCNYYSVSNKKGTAPQFYIKKSKLGKYVKITLNDNGNIHTIFEDYKKILKQQETNT